MTDDELITRVKLLYDACKGMPPQDERAWSAVRQLRDLIPELLLLITTLQRKDTLRSARTAFNQIAVVYEIPNKDAAPLRALLVDPSSKPRRRR